MKLLSLALSLLRSKKRSFILMMICIIFSTLLFNFAITVSLDYLAEKAYITSNRYDKKILHGTLSSKAPITDEKIVSEFNKVRNKLPCRALPRNHIGAFLCKQPNNRQRDK